VNELLQKYAGQQGVSFLDLMKDRLRKYVEWDFWMGRVGGVVLPLEMLRSILEATDDTKLTKAARDSAIHSREWLNFRFKRKDHEAFLEWISLLSKYARTIKYDMQSDGRSFKVTARHNLGQKWSDYLREFTIVEFEDLFNIVPQVAATENSLVVEWTFPQEYSRSN